jgi:Mg/Co/Ni transporter MgtE
MKTTLKIDLQKLEKMDNVKFFRLLDESRWQKLINTMKDAANNKSIEELMTELVEDGK